MITRLNVGGPALQATILTERLGLAGYDSLLVAGVEDSHEGNYLALHRKRLENLVVLPALRRELRALPDLAALASLIRLLRRWKPDIVHTHTAKAGALGRLAASLTRVPVIVHTYHGHVFRGYFGPARARVFLAIERWLARHTDRVLTVSPAVRTELLALGIGRPAQVQVMPIGLDLGRFLECERTSGEFRAELGLGATVPLVGIVARLVPIKDHDVFLDAAHGLVRRLPDSHFVIVGDGERRSELTARADRLGLGRRVHFVGWRDDLDRIYADLDVVALTSRNEGSPVSLIEAMAAARPVVATRVGGVADLVEDGVTGHLVSPGDAVALTEALRALLEDPEQRRMMGTAGRKLVASAFGAERLLSDMDAVYRELLAAKLVRGSPPRRDRA